MLQSLPVPVVLPVPENGAICAVSAGFALRCISLHFCSRPCQQALAAWAVSVALQKPLLAPISCQGAGLQVDSYTT